MKRISKKLSKKIAMMIVAGGMLGMSSSALAVIAPVITIGTNGAATSSVPPQFISDLVLGSNGEYIGVKSGVYGASYPLTIKTADGGVAHDVKGVYCVANNIQMNFSDGTIQVVSTNGTADAIYLQGKNGQIFNLASVSATGTGLTQGIFTITGINPITFIKESSSISATSSGGMALGIAFGDILGAGGPGSGTTTISNLSSITAETTGSSQNAYGIYAKNGNNVSDNATFSVSFDTANNTTGGSISAYSASGANYGIMFDTGSTGTSEVKNVKTITAGVRSTKDEQQQEVISSGTAYGIYAAAGENTVTFTGAGSSIIAKSSGGDANGIKFMDGGSNPATGTTSISGLGSITAKATGNKYAYGIYVRNGNAAGEESAPATFSVTMTNGSISAYSDSGSSTGISIGSIRNKNEGITEIKNVKSLTAGVTKNDNDEEVIASGSATGISITCITAVNRIEFVSGSSITAKTSGGKQTDNVRGIFLAGGTNTITGLGSITAETTADNDKNDTCGIKIDLSDTNTKSTISFKGNGGQAITAKSTNANKTYSIYNLANAVEGKSATVDTTVNFENSILSGKIYNGFGAGSGTKTAILTLNFNNGGVWTPKAADVTGTVNVNVNNGGSIKVIETDNTYEPSEGSKSLNLSGGTVNITVNAGGTMDLRGRNAAGEVITTTGGTTKTVNLGSGSFTATPETKGETTTYPILSFDALTSNNGLTTDQIKTTGAVSGTIALGSVNIKSDDTTKAWSAEHPVKKADIFVDDASKAKTGIAIIGTRTTQTSNGWLYTFTGGTQGGNVQATQKLDSHTLPEIIQGSDVGAKAVNTYSLTQNETLTEDLGTLNNEKRADGLTINGNSKTLSKGTATNGTVTLANSTDKLTVTGLTVSGFTKFADNAGTLNLSGVIFTGTTGADVITGTGKTVISGVVTADKNIAQQVELQNGANLTATGISVDGTGEVKGIYGNVADTTHTASASVGTVIAKSSGNNAYGISFGTSTVAGIGTTTITGLGSITAEAAGIGKFAYGIYAKNGNAAGEAGTPATFSVSFADAGGSISAFSAKSLNYGIRFDTGSTGTSEVNNVKSITVGIKSGSNPEVISEGAAYGIYASGGVNTVAFTGADSSITAKSSKTSAYGIDLTGGNGESVADYTITGLGSITAEALKTTSGAAAYGIYALNGNTAETDATFSVAFDKTTGGSISAYSANGSNYGINFAKDCTGTSEVKNVKTITAGVSSTLDEQQQEVISKGDAYGICAQAGVNTVAFTGGTASSIKAKSSSGNSVYGISFGTVTVLGTGTTTISGLGSITAETTGSSQKAHGIYAMNGNAAGEAADPATFSVTMSNGSISAYSASGANFGIRFDSDSTGTNEVLNVKTITAGVKKDSDPEVISSGAAYGICAQAGVNTVAFTGGTASSIKAKSSTKSAYGIYVFGGTNTVSGLGGITVSGGTSSASIELDGGTLNLVDSTVEASGTYTTVDVTGDATLNLSGSTDTTGSNITGSVKVADGKTLTASISKESQWTITGLSDTGTLSITNNGTLTYKDVNNLKAAHVSLTGGTGVLNLNNVTLDLSGDSNIDDIKVNELSGTTCLKIDVNMNDFTSDKLSVKTLAAGAVVDLIGVNVTKDIAVTSGVSLPSDVTPTTINYISAEKGTATYKVGGKTVAEGGSVTYTNNYKYTFTLGNDGKFNYKVEAADVTFAKLVQGELETGTLSLTDDLVNGATAGDITQGTTTPIIVNLNGHNLTSTNANTVVIGTNKTFTLNGGSGETAGTTDANTSFSISGGTLAISGKTIVNGAITNGGTLTTGGTTTLEGAVTGSGSIINTGTLNIAAAKLGNAVTNTGGTTNLGAGTLTKAITDGTVNITGDVSSVTSNFVTLTSFSVNKDKNLTFTDTNGTLNTVIGGEGNVTIGNGTAAAKVSSTGDKFTNSGTLSVANNGTVELTGGTLNKAITNAGTVKLAGAELGAAVTNGRLTFTLKSGEQSTLYTVLGDYVAGTTNQVATGVTLILKGGNFDKTISNAGLVKLEGVTLGSNANITGDVELVGSNEVGDAAVLNKLKEVNIVKDATLTLSGGTLTNNVIGDGTLVIKEGSNVAYEPEGTNKINAKTIIEVNAELDPRADDFTKEVENHGTLFLNGGDLGVEVTNFSTGTLNITEPITVATDGKVILESGATLKVEAEKVYAANENAATADKAAIQGLDNADKLDVATGSKVALTGSVENGGYYVILSGAAVSGLNVWQELGLTELFPDDAEVTAYSVTNKNGVLSLVAIKTTKAEENINCFAGVQQGMLSVNNQVADALADHLGLAGKGRAEDGYSKDVWASYIRNKDDVGGMKTSSNQGSFGSDYRAQVNGVTVGADLFTTKKAIGGIAINYATGDTNGSGAATGSTVAQINNKTKYYGVELYNRITNNHHAVLMDIGYMQGKNEISVAEAKSWTADADVNSITAGVRWERDFQFKNSKLVPFAGVRYIRLQSKDFTNSKGLAYSTNSQNLFQPKLGVTWTGEYKMAESGWTFKPRAEVGYLWALGNREAETNAVINKYYATSKFDVTDKSSYYAKLGLDFNCRNFTAGVGYSYMKGDAVRGNRWNINMSWSF